MPRKAKKQRVPGQYYIWLLGTRNRVYYADGRSNPQDVGRHSLGTRDRQEALERLRRLDVVKAVEFGLADAAVLNQDVGTLLTLEDGRQRYTQFISRPTIQGGASANTVKRYRPVFDKFVTFAEHKGICYWHQVTRHVLMQYGAWLEKQDYHDKTQYIELTVLKQVIKWLVGEKLLPPASIVTLKLKKPEGTSTYCYSQAQVRAIVGHCRDHADLCWLADVVVALATTGLRISESAAMRWSDVDLERGLLHLTDTTRRGRRSRRHEARSTKSHRDRTLALYKDLHTVLQHLPRLSDGRVFHGPHGGTLKPDTVRSVLTREVLPPLSARFPASGDDPGIIAGRLHSFRHYFCSMAADGGVPEQMLLSWLGQRDSSMVRHYYHLRQDEARRRMDRIPFLGHPAPDSESDQPG